MKNVFDFLQDNWQYIGPVLYEILSRVIPTKRNISLLDNAVKVVGFLLKNRRKPQPEDVVPIQAETGTALDAVESADSSDTVNSVVVDRFKHIISVIALTCIASFVVSGNVAYGQTNTTNKSVRWYNATKSVVESEVATLDATYGNVGAMYYLSDSNKFKLYYDHAWHDLGSGGGGGVNIYNTSDALTGNRSLTGAGFDLDIVGLSGGTIQSTGAYSIVSTTNDLNLTADQEGTFTSTNGNLTFNAANTLVIQGGTNGVEISTPGVSLTEPVSISGGVVLLDGDSNIEIQTTQSGGEFIDLTSSEVYLNASTDIEIASNDVLLLSTQNTMSINADAVDIQGGTSFSAYGQTNAFLSSDATGSIFLEAGPTSISVEGSAASLFFNSTGPWNINTDAGTPGYVLTSNGSSAAPTWEPAGGGGASPAAPDRSIQINDAGSFGSDDVYIPSAGNVDLGATTSANAARVIRALSNSTTSGTEMTFRTISGSISPGAFNFEETGDVTNPNIQFIFNGPTTTTSAFLRTEGTLGAIWLETGFVNGGDAGNSEWLFDASGVIIAGTTVLRLGDEANGTAGMLRGADGTSGTENGKTLTIRGANGYAVGDNDGGDIIITEGLANGSGAHGEVILNITRTSCSGAPSGALANISGVLNVCP